MRGKHLGYFQSGIKIIQKVNQCFQSSLCRNIDMRAIRDTRHNEKIGSRHENHFREARLIMTMQTMRLERGHEEPHRHLNCFKSLLYLYCY